MHAKSRDQAVFALLQNEIEEASLDYGILWDSGGSDHNWQSDRTGYAVLLWMKKYDLWPKKIIRVHSSNVEGKKRMLAFIILNKPDSLELKEQL
jgi:hypothetical protein